MVGHPCPPLLRSQNAVHSGQALVRYIQGSVGLVRQAENAQLFVVLRRDKIHLVNAVVVDGAYRGALALGQPVFQVLLRNVETLERCLHALHV